MTYGSWTLPSFQTNPNITLFALTHLHGNRAPKRREPESLQQKSLQHAWQPKSLQHAWAAGVSLTETSWQDHSCAPERIHREGNKEEVTVILTAPNQAYSPGSEMFWVVIWEDCVHWYMVPLWSDYNPGDTYTETTSITTHNPVRSVSSYWEYGGGEKFWDNDTQMDASPGFFFWSPTI